MFSFALLFLRESHELQPRSRHVSRPEGVTLHRLTAKDRGCVLSDLLGVAAASRPPPRPVPLLTPAGLYTWTCPMPPTCASRRMSSLLWFFLRDPKAGGAAAWSTVSNIEKGRTFFSFSLGGTSPSSAEEKRGKKITDIQTVCNRTSDSCVCFPPPPLLNPALRNASRIVN